MKVCLTCSAGGHLSEMLQLQSFFKQFDYFFVTFKRPDTDFLAKTEKVFFVERPARNPVKTIQCFWQAWKIIQREKPDLIISTGADVTVPICLAGKLLGKKIVFIESFCRPTKPSVSGQLAYRFSDLFIYQWKPLEKFYSRGKFGGSIF